MRFHVFFVRRIFRLCLHKIWRGFKHIVRTLERNPFVHKLETSLDFVPPPPSPSLRKSTYLDKKLETCLFLTALVLILSTVCQAVCSSTVTGLLGRGSN